MSLWAWVKTNQKSPKNNIPKSNMSVTSIDCCKFLILGEFFITLSCLFAFIFNHETLTSYTNTNDWTGTFILVNVLVLTYLVKEYIGLLWKIFGIVVFGCVIRTVIACLIGILFIHIAQTPINEFDHFLNFEDWTNQDFFDFK